MTFKTLFVAEEEQSSSVWMKGRGCLGDLQVKKIFNLKLQLAAALPIFSAHILAPTFCHFKPLSSSAPWAHFYGFNLNECFLISCLQSCQSEKYLYYMRLAVPELSLHYNTTSLSSLPLITQLVIQTTERLVPLLLQLYMLRLIGDIFLSNFVKIFRLVQAWDCSWKIRLLLVNFFSSWRNRWIIESNFLIYFTVLSIE